jgi:hypothetical protein
MSGINVFIFYSTIIYEDAGGSTSTALYFTIGVGAVNMASTLISLFFADKIGRRLLFLVGAFGMMA